MSDSKHTVTIDIIAEAKQFRQELKKASNDANAFNKGMKDVKKAGGRQDKDLAKLAKDANKFNKSAAKESIDYEKKLLQLIKQRQQEMKKIGNQESAAFKQKRKEAAEAAGIYSDLRSNRAKATGGGSGLGSKIGRGAYNGLVGGALGIGGLAIGALTARVGKAGDAATQLRASGINLAGDASIRSRRELMDITNQGTSAGYDPMDTSAQAAAMSRATGLGAQVVHGQQFARAGMLDMGQATGFMGMQARGGGANNPSEQKRDLERIMTLAFSNGLQKGRFGEYLEGISSLVEGALGRDSGDVNGTGYAKALAQLDSTGKSGLQGSRGASVLSRLEQGFMHGGGAAGKALSLSAMGFGTPGGNTGYYDARKQMEKGFSDPDNMNKMLGNLKNRYGGNSQAAAIAGAEQTGLSLQQMEDLLGMNGPELQKEIEKLAKESVPLEKQMVDVLKGDLSAQAILQSKRQQQLVEEGDLVVDSLNSLQDSTNQMIDKYWPLAVKSLEVIAKTVEVIAQATTDAFDFWSTDSIFSKDKSKMTPGERALEDTESQIKDIKRQLSTGYLDSRSAEKELQAIADRNKDAAAKTSGDLGFLGTGMGSDKSKLEAASKAAQDARTSLIGRTYGSGMGDTLTRAQAAQAEDNQGFRAREAEKRAAEAKVRAEVRARSEATPAYASADGTLVDVNKEQLAVLKTLAGNKKAVDRTPGTLQKQSF